MRAVSATLPVVCRVLRVVIVAQAERQLELRRALSALDYEIVAAVSSVDEIDLAADVAVVWEPDGDTVDALRTRGLKVASIGGADGDLPIDPTDVRSFRSRVWDLFRP